MQGAGKLGEKTNNVSGSRQTASYLTCVLVLQLGFGFAALCGAEPPIWDNFSDTWVATDALGRTVATAETAGRPRQDRVVAMFYFLWHDQVSSHCGRFVALGTTKTRTNMIVETTVESEADRRRRRGSVLD